MKKRLPRPRKSLISILSLTLALLFTAFFPIIFNGSADLALAVTSAAPTITITSPDSSDVWAPGSIQTISWHYTGSPGEKVNLSLYKNGNLRAAIKLGVPIGPNGNGNYSWKIPAGEPLGTDYQVKVLIAGNPTCADLSDVFSIMPAGSSDLSNQEQKPPVEPPATDQARQVLIADPAFVSLSAIQEQNNPLGSFYLQVTAHNPSYPVEVSYLVLNPNGTPSNPSPDIVVKSLNEEENTWGGSAQYFGHTEVGGWAQPQYQKNPQQFLLPHYRTCVMMLARYEKIYIVFLRENDGRLTYQVYQGGAFNGLEVPGLANVERVGNQFRIHSMDSAVELGIWDKGQYRHDEVSGWAQESYQPNDKYYEIPRYGMFMFMFGRYDKLGLILGNFNDGRLGTICFSGSSFLGSETVPGLCDISSGNIIAGQSGLVPQIKIRALTANPVEVSHFSFANTCWQWEVAGWAQEAYKANPQQLPLKHYTPGFFMCSRYDRAGIYFYNENDAKLGILPLSSSTLHRSAQTPSDQSTVSAAEGIITVLLNGKLMAFDQPPLIISGRTLVPMRALFEALGAEVSWDGPNQTVTASKDGTVITLVIDSPTAFINGQQVELSAPAMLIASRTLVPLRFIAEALDAEVSWDGALRIITINQ